MVRLYVFNFALGLVFIVLYCTYVSYYLAYSINCRLNRQLCAIPLAPISQLPRLRW